MWDYQYPGTLGDIKDPSEAISKIHKYKWKSSSCM